MHKSSTKISITKEKLTKHFKEHFSYKQLMPPKIENPNNFDYLKDLPVEVNEAPPDCDETKVVKTLKIVNLGRQNLS